MLIKYFYFRFNDLDCHPPSTNSPDHTQSALVLTLPQVQELVPVLSVALHEIIRQALWNWIWWKELRILSLS
jgi:hypothetical protein